MAPQEDLGLASHPSVQILNVDLAWDGSLKPLEEALVRNVGSAGFPALANSLSNPRQPTTLLCRATINRIVMAKASTAHPFPILRLERPRNKALLLLRSKVV